MTIRTYIPRRGHVSKRQAAAIADADGLLLPAGDEILDLGNIFAGLPVILEIGFGTGSATVAMAAADLGLGILAVDVHTPGLGDLLYRARENRLTNIRAIAGDALVVAEQMLPESVLAGIRTFFPDPWPKARHHKRRLVTPANAALLASRTQVGGFWHLATDWAPYAEQMQEVLDASRQWTGGVIPRPTDRPVTKYETTAIHQHRNINDLWYRRIKDS
ncbi:MAG: tRNA (guanine(46)-N(7))-methyltransferase TrmB [Candidatus Nanopelagicales bacterium]|nr:tRNA (guanine(46)-N(7))-methyltransferase TrmB [Candidatus Nanopelagicales bacterium]